MIITLKGADFSGAGNNIGNLSQIGGTFTFTINPTPSDATVKINGTTRKSITGAYGTAISWEVSKNGYNTRTGSLTMPLGGKTMSVSLTAVGSVTPPVTPEQPGTGGGSGTTTSIRVTDFSDEYRAMVNATTGKYTSQSFNETMGGSQVINKYDIPSGATQVNYQVFKTGGGYGSGFEDANGNWISGYANTDANLKRHTLDIPSNASKFVFMYMDNGYADHQGKPRFDYIEFLGVFEGSGESPESPESPDSGNTESVKSYTFTTDVRGLLDTATGVISDVGNSSGGTQVINNHTIPSGAKTVKYQVFKTGKTYGSGFVDAGGNWISGFAANSGETTGDWKTLSIPSNATVFKHMYTDNDYIKTMTGYNSSWDFQYVEFLFS